MSLILSAVALIAAAVGKSIFNAWKRASFRRSVAAFEPNVVYLYGFPRMDITPSFSFPVLKVETFLRLAKIPYCFVATVDAAWVSPTERLPCIVFNGKVWPDSQAIIEYLTDKFHLDVDSRLTADLVAKGTAVRRVVEDSARLHFARHLWVDNSPFMTTMFSRLTGVPSVVMRFFVRSLRRKAIALLNLVGEGDLTDVQYHSEFEKDVCALETFLGDGPFLFGARTTSYDACLYGLAKNLVAMADVLPCPALKRAAEGKLGLFVDRMDLTLFPDMIDICSRRKEHLQDFTRIVLTQPLESFQ